MLLRCITLLLLVLFALLPASSMVMQSQRRWRWGKDPKTRRPLERKPAFKVGPQPVTRALTTTLAIPIALARATRSEEQQGMVGAAEEVEVAAGNAVDAVKLVGTGYFAANFALAMAKSAATIAGAALLGPTFKVLGVVGAASIALEDGRVPDTNQTVAAPPKRNAQANLEEAGWVMAAVLDLALSEAAEDGGATSPAAPSGADQKPAPAPATEDGRVALNGPAEAEGDQTARPAVVATLQAAARATRLGTGTSEDRPAPPPSAEELKDAPSSGDRRLILIPRAAATWVGTLALSTLACCLLLPRAPGVAPLVAPVVRRLAPKAATALGLLALVRRAQQQGGSRDLRLVAAQPHAA